MQSNPSFAINSIELSLLSFVVYQVLVSGSIITTFIFGYCCNNGLKAPSSFVHSATDIMLLGSSSLISCSEKKVCPIRDIPSLPYFACTHIISLSFNDTSFHLRIFLSPSGMIIASITLLPLSLEGRTAGNS